MKDLDYDALKYADLQKLAKLHGIRANQKASILKEELKKVIVHSGQDKIDEVQAEVPTENNKIVEYDLLMHDGTGFISKNLDDDKRSTDSILKVEQAGEAALLSELSPKPDEKKNKRSGTYELESPAKEQDEPQQKIQKRSIDELPIVQELTDEPQRSLNSTYELESGFREQEQPESKKRKSSLEDVQSQNSPDENRRRRSGTYELESPVKEQEDGPQKKKRKSSLKELPVTVSRSSDENRRRRSGTYELESPSKEEQDESRKGKRKSSLGILPVIDADIGANCYESKDAHINKEAPENLGPSGFSWMEQMLDQINKVSKEKEEEIENRVEQRMAALVSGDSTMKKQNSKTPNFKKLHEKHFSKMADITQCYNRRLQAMALFSKTPASQMKPSASSPQVQRSGAKIVKPVQRRFGTSGTSKPPESVAKAKSPRLLSASKVLPGDKKIPSSPGQKFSSRPITPAKDKLTVSSPSRQFTVKHTAAGASPSRHQATGRTMTPALNRGHSMTHAPTTASKLSTSSASPLKTSLSRVHQSPSRPSFTVGIKSVTAPIKPTQREPLKTYTRKAPDLRAGIKQRPVLQNSNGSTMSSHVARRMAAVKENIDKRKQDIMLKRNLNK